jgi:hypothetical protein
MLDCSHASLTDVVTAIGTLLAALAAVYAAWVGIKAYREGTTARLAQTLIEAEAIFKESLPTFAIIEDDERYANTILPLLTKVKSGAPLSDGDVALLTSIDRAIRFFFIFLVHQRFEGDTNAILKAYLYYWALISDETRRTDLRHYIDAYYPGTAWSPDVSQFRARAR